MTRLLSDAKVLVACVMFLLFVSGERQREREREREGGREGKAEPVRFKRLRTMNE